MLTPQLIKFLIVGCSNTALSFAVFNILYYYAFFIGQAFTAQCVSYAVGVFWSFLLNRNWTFQAKHQSASATLFKFILLQIAMLLLSACLIEWAALSVPLPAWASWVAVMAGITVLNFIGSKVWVFRYD